MPFPDRARRKRAFRNGRFIVRVWVEEDTCPDLSYLEQDYHGIGVTDAEADLYHQQDKERLAAYYRREWAMYGIVATVEVSVPGAEVVTHEVGHASCWGYESDSSDGFFREEYRNFVREAIADARHTTKALVRHLNPIAIA
jgi:hypothetical protein